MSGLVSLSNASSLVKFDGFSFQKQVSIMSQTDLAVSIHGAQLTNIMFIPPGGGVIEIFNPFFKFMAILRKRRSWSTLHFGILQSRRSPSKWDRNGGILQWTIRCMWWSMPFSWQSRVSWSEWDCFWCLSPDSIVVFVISASVSCLKWEQFLGNCEFCEMWPIDSGPHRWAA